MRWQGEKMYKVAPAIYRVGKRHMDSGNAGYHDYRELLEVVNSCRDVLFGKVPLQPLELLERFKGMNVVTQDLLKLGIAPIHSLYISVEPKPKDEFEAGHVPYFSVVTPELVEEMEQKDPTVFQLFTSAGWGMRVIEAVRKGGEHSLVFSPRKGKFQSQVWRDLLCQSEPFIM